METLAKAVVKSGKMGTPLPDVFSTMARKKAHFRRGGTSLIAGPPGSFKSTLALNLTVGWAEKGLKGLYISADSDEATVGKRCAALITGDRMDQVEKTIAADTYRMPLRKLTDVNWEFRGMRVKQVEMRMDAFSQKYGCWPDFVVIDNLMNCVDGPGDWTGLITMTRDLDELARATSSHIMILHHTQEGHENTNRPPARWEIMGKVTQFPRMALTVSANGTHMMIAVVKNTNGPQDPTGNDMMDFTVDADTCQIEQAELG